MPVVRAGKLIRSLRRPLKVISLDSFLKLRVMACTGPGVMA
jgi:hypothetical protein